jgi:hypothetical protein
MVLTLVLLPALAGLFGGAIDMSAHVFGIRLNLRLPPRSRSLRRYKLIGMRSSARFWVAFKAGVKAGPTVALPVVTITSGASMTNSATNLRMPPRL